MAIVLLLIGVNLLQMLVGSNQGARPAEESKIEAEGRGWGGVLGEGQPALSSPARGLGKLPNGVRGKAPA